MLLQPPLHGYPLHNELQPVRDAWPPPNNAQQLSCDAHTPNVPPSIHTSEHHQQQHHSE